MGGRAFQSVANNQIRIIVKNKKKKKKQNKTSYRVIGQEKINEKPHSERTLLHWRISTPFPNSLIDRNYGNG